MLSSPGDGPHQSPSKTEFEASPSDPVEQTGVGGGSGLHSAWTGVHAVLL